LLTFAGFTVERPGIWDTVQSHLMNHIEEINASLSKAGMAMLKTSGIPDEIDHDHLPTPPATPNCVMLPGTATDDLNGV